MSGYAGQAGGLWVRKDRHGRTYYFISAVADGKEYKYHAFASPKKEGNRPDFILYALDEGRGKPTRFAPRPSRSSEEEQALYKGQDDGSSPSGTKEKYEVKEPPWPDNDANEEAGRDDERMEDGGNQSKSEEEDDGLPY